MLRLFLNTGNNDRDASEPAKDWSVKDWVWRLTQTLVVVLLATAVLPIMPVDWWWVRIGDFPRLQLMGAYCSMLLALIFFRERSWVRFAAASLILSCGIQIYWVFAYFPFAKEQVQDARNLAPERQLRIMSANVLQENEDFEPLLKLIRRRQPDLLVLCEVNDRWMRDLKPLHEIFPHRVTHPQENRYGIALYSRLDILRAEVRTLIHEEIPSIDAVVRMRCGHVVRVVAVHPNPPRPGEDTTKRDAELVAVGLQVHNEQTAIVLGDMNDVGWSRTSDLFREVSGLLDPRMGRGFFSTFDATSSFLRYPLDYVFHSDDFRVASLEVLPFVGSDHFPLWIQLSHEPSARPTQDPPELDAGDIDDAQEALKEASNIDSRFIDVEIEAGSDLDNH